MDFKGFIGGGYQSQAVTFDSQRCVNLYAEIDESQQGKGDHVGFLIGTPGKKTLLTLPTSPGRGKGLFTASNGRCFVVSGNTLYELVQNSTTLAWSYLTWGTLNTDTGPVSMTENGIQLVIVDGVDGWVFTYADNILTLITDPDMPRATKACYLDQSVIFNDYDTSKFYWSNLLDASDIDALDFASAEGSPDLLVTMEVFHRQLWLLGTDSIEVWTNAGAEGFQRIDGVFIEYGCAAAQSTAVIDNTLFWLGGGKVGHGIIWRSEGFTPKRVSTHAVEYALAQYGDLSQAIAYSYTEGGHQFYVLTIPGTNTSWAYDVATGLWAERCGFSAGAFTRDRSNGYALYRNQHIVNDYQTGKIYQLDANTYTDDGQARKWLRSSPYLAKNLHRIIHHRLQVDIQAGVGLVTGQGVDPQIMLRYTNDGRTWSAERKMGMGAIGNYLYRAYASPLGSSRTRAYEISGTDPVKIVLLSAEIEVEECAS